MTKRSMYRMEPILACIALVGLVFALSGLRRAWWESRSLSQQRAIVQSFKSDSSRALPSFAPTVFFLSGCPSCQRAAPFIKSFEDDRLRFRWVDISDPVGDSLYNDALLAYRIPDSRSTHLPVVILGDRLLSGPDAIHERLRSLTERWKRGEGRTSPVLNEESAISYGSATPRHPPVNDCCSEIADTGKAK